MPVTNSFSDDACLRALGSLFHAWQALKTKVFVPVDFAGRDKELPNRKVVGNTFLYKQIAHKLRIHPVNGFIYFGHK